MKWIVLLCLFISSDLLAGQNVYLSVNRLRNAEQVNGIRYADYDHIYLFHPNKLTASEVTSQPLSYSNGEKGAALVPQLLKKSAGKTKRIYSIGHQRKVDQKGF